MFAGASGDKDIEWMGWDCCMVMHSAPTRRVCACVRRGRDVVDVKGHVRPLVRSAVSVCGGGWCIHLSVGGRRRRRFALKRAGNFCEAKKAQNSARAVRRPCQGLRRRVRSTVHVHKYCRPPHDRRGGGEGNGAEDERICVSGCVVGRSREERERALMCKHACLLRMLRRWGE